MRRTQSAATDTQRSTMVTRRRRQIGDGDGLTVGGNALRHRRLRKGERRGIGAGDTKRQTAGEVSALDDDGLSEGNADTRRT